MKKAFILIALLSATRAFAGATNVFLTCDSADKSIHLETDFPGDEVESAVTIKTKDFSKAYIDQATVEDAKLNNQDLNKEFPMGYEVLPIAGIDRTDIKVLTVSVVKDGMSALSLVAVPESIKLKRTGTRGYTGVFTGKLRANNPNDQMKDIRATLSCKYDYSI